MNKKPNRIRHLFYKLSVILLLVFVSCARQENKEILIGNLSHKDFEDVISIDGTVKAVRSTTLSCPREIQSEIIFLIEDGTIVKEGDIVCVLESRELQNDYDQLIIEQENAIANFNKSKADLELKYSMLDAQVKSNEAQTEISNLDSLQLMYSSPNQRKITELGLKRSAIEKTKLLKKLKALEIINKSQIRGLEARLGRWDNRIAESKESLEKLTIKAPQDGMAIRAISWITDEVLKEGDQAWSGMPLINLPDLSVMKVTILASETNYKRININDNVEFTFDALPGNTAWGKITSKAPIGQQISRNSKIKVFEIEASIDSTKTLPEPGLSANCKVIISRIKDTIVVPQLAIFDIDSMKVVYVKKSNGFEKRQVLPGTSSPKTAVIIKGLNGNEKISLIKPSSSKIKWTKLLPKNDSSKIKHEEKKSIKPGK